MSTLDKADAARALGMKEREIRRVLRTEAGPVVITHDGTETLVDREAGTLTFLNREAGAGSFDPSLIDSASAGGAGHPDAITGPAAEASIRALSMGAVDGKMRPDPEEDVDEDAVARRAQAASGPSVPVVTDVPPTKADGTAWPEQGGDAKRAADFEADHAKRETPAGTADDETPRATGKSDPADSDPARPVKKAPASRGRS